MSPELQLELAQEEANKHRTRKVLVKTGDHKTAAEYEHVKVKTVHVTSPNFAAYPDLDDAGKLSLKKHAMANKLSIHEFTFEDGQEEAVSEDAPKSKKKK